MKKIAIIGGAGRMGRRLAEFLAKDGKEVIVAGRDISKLAQIKKQLAVQVMSTEQAAQTADVVILAVPQDSLEAVLKEISPRLRAGQLLMDIASTKTKPVELMHRHANGATVLGTHPMFGPGAKEFTGQNIVLTPTNRAEQEQAEKAANYLRGKGAKVTLLAPEKHDEAMAGVLGLAHFAGIVAAETLAGDPALKQMLEVSGTSFRLLTTLAEAVLSEDAEFYESLQKELPVEDIECRFVEAAEKWAGIVREGRGGEFASEMKKLKERMKAADPDFDKAYERMYRVNEALRGPPT